MRTALARLGKLGSVPVLPIIPAPQPWRYRHTARLHLGRGIGYYRRQSRALVPVADCLLLPRQLSALLGPLSTYLRGVEGELVLRLGRATGEALVLVRAARASLPRLRAAARSLFRNPVLVGFVGEAGGARRVFFGRDAYREECSGRKFLVPAGAFFQANPHIIPELLAAVTRFCRLTGREVLYDLYCGVGLFAVVLASHCARVYGIEAAGEAVAAARANAGLNQVRNASFIAGRVEEVLKEAASQAPPDVVVLDPPRSGCSPRVLEELALLAPRRIVYVSCDPATLARDLGFLAAHGYRVEAVQPLDMFPQTYHIEAVALCERS